MRKSRAVSVGGVVIGGGNPVVIQSMCDTDTRDAAATVSQINALEAAGCEVVRVAVLNEDAGMALKDIKRQINIPIVADVHFDYRLALLSIKNGCDKLRINPGNIGGVEKTREVAMAAKSAGIPIRVGVNGGSLERGLDGLPQPEALAKSALRNAEILTDCGFDDIVIAVKSSSVPTCVAATKIVAEQCDYPVHIGVTEAGTPFHGAIKSAAGIGALLLGGIGDTVRVSLTGDPLEEIKVAKALLSALEIRRFGVEVISCPTCGRTKIPLVALAEEVERRCAHITSPLRVAVMGCAVNGPGEARHADVGVAGGDGRGVIFMGGEIVRDVGEGEIVEALMCEVNKLAAKREKKRGLNTRAVEGAL